MPHIPVLYIAVFVALTLFYYFNQGARHRSKDRREQMKEKQEELLEMLRREKEKTAEEGE